MLARTLCLLSVLVSAVLAAPLAPRAAPTVQLDQGTFIGASDGKTNKFMGIPFAKAPVGDLRFNLPVAVDPYTGTHTVTSFGPSCPQQAIDFDLPSQLAADAVDFIVNSIYQAVFPAQEDCLNLNVIVPAGTNPTDKLPVVAWIFGGGFELGSPAQYDGTGIVSRSVDMKQPVIYVSMNYRVSAFGFLASQEVKDAGVGNLGLQDQRLALRWIQKYISAFGGDPTKVTIWGESAGAISVALHLVTNGGNSEGLFRGAFMQSGSPIPVGDISHGQADYDALVSQTGCVGAADTLQCLRQVPYDKLKKAVDASPGIFSPQSLRLTWLPRVDGKFLTDTPQNLVQRGSVADVPFVTGDCDDEGTLFSLSTLNITTDDELRSYITSNYMPQVESKSLDELFIAYPADITQGSPFNTGILNALSPQYKRMAAMQGDLVFQAPRRFFLQHRSGLQPTWSFLSKRLKGLPALGSAHATDILNIYGGGELADYLINFAYNLDPNGKTVPSWPQYTTSSPKLLTFLDGSTPTAITNDDYRVDAMNIITELSLQFPI
ncbi:carotenoid ester lipase precursor [Trametes sanguinea]|nr:carotenoid ester lipase precursor [Trametes sanguinea]